jgi:hypothetical protein
MCFVVFRIMCMKSYFFQLLEGGTECENIFVK